MPACVYACLCACESFIAEWISGKDVEETVYSLRKTSRLFGAVSGILEMQEEREEERSERGEEDGQGRNLHSEAQIDAKQLLNSCKVEQLLGRREGEGWRR